MDEFWALIESARAEVVERAGDHGKALADVLRLRLVAMPRSEILDFYGRLSEATSAVARWDVWAAAYLIGGGCSDDSFADFRAGLVALGRDWYERVRADPDVLAEHPWVRQAVENSGERVVFAEAMNHAASRAYAEVSGDDEAFYEAWESRARQTGDEAAERSALGAEFDFDDIDEMGRRLPRLTARFASRSETDD
jgi:hypothetical protein